MTTTGDHKDLGDTITPHPADSRVAETTSVENFHRAAHMPQYSAVILRRNNTASHKRLHRCFNQIVQNESQIVALNNIVSMHIGKNNKVDFKSFPKEYLSVQKEIVDMARAYNNLASYRNFDIVFSAELDIEPHDHHFPVLNCTWLADGTTWENEKGESLHVAEGDWFFFKEGFKHWSPKNAPGRITMIALPPTRNI